MSSKLNAGTDSNLAGSIPRAVIHRKILDAAESRPDATIEAIATDVSGASDTLVEQVLNEYGDPAKASAGPSGSASDEPTPTQPEDTVDVGENELPDFTELTQKQQEAVRTIEENPEASQREIASMLGVSGATINVRVNSIPGFDWAERQEFATTMFENRGENPDRESANEREDDASNRFASIEARIDALERDRESASTAPLDDPELAHKIVHACMSAENITDEEELRIIKSLLDAGP